MTTPARSPCMRVEHLRGQWSPRIVACPSQSTPGMTMTKTEMEQGRRNILARRQAVLTEGGPHAQELATKLWTDAVALELAIMRRWSR